MKKKSIFLVLKKSSEFRTFLYLFFFIGFLADVFFIKRENTYTDWGSDVRLFLLLFLWLFIWKILHYTSFTTFKLAGLFLTFLSAFFIFFRDHSSVERLASWVYIYLATGVIQQLFEVKRRHL